MIKAKDLTKVLAIHPRTNKFWKVAWELASDDFYRRHLPSEVVTAADGINYAIRTSRISGSVEISFRELTPYQTLKVLVDVANNVENIAGVARYLNKNYS